MTESNTTTAVTAKPKSDVTPYRAAQIATVALRGAGKLAADKKIEPQVMYSNKSIARYGEAKSAGGTGVMFVGDSFYAWLQTQLRGTGVVRSRGNLGALLAEYVTDIDDEDLADEPTDDEDADSPEDIAAMAFENVAAQADTSALDAEDGDKDVVEVEKSEAEQLAELEIEDAS
jgi:hypothetical protein